MPLINCPDCNKKISDQANACINCGRSMQNQSIKKIEGTVNTIRQGGKYEAVGGILAITGVFVMIVVSGSVGALMLVVGLGIFIAGRFM